MAFFPDPGLSGHSYVCDVSDFYDNFLLIAVSPGNTTVTQLWRFDFMYSTNTWNSVTTLESPPIQPTAPQYSGDNIIYYDSKPCIYRNLFKNIIINQEIPTKQITTATAGDTTVTGTVNAKLDPADFAWIMTIFAIAIVLAIFYGGYKLMLKPWIRRRR
jgi:hypothetical protein